VKEILQFTNREEFRDWLSNKSTKSDGVWLLFGKKDGPITLSAHDALEEALCFGWIDGQMQSLNDKTYKKYFSCRRINNKWSDKNKSLAEQLEKQGIMTDLGRDKIEEAKRNGQWAKTNTLPIDDEQISFLSIILKEYESAYTNFLAMSPSIKKTYARAYYDAKTEAGRSARIKWMVNRLNRNLKPM
jgi:uncharacterized protein YdeI (YjbR/CyaY-like superfamily)